MYHRHGCASYPLQTWKAPFRFFHFLLLATVVTLRKAFCALHLHRTHSRSIYRSYPRHHRILEPTFFSKYFFDDVQRQVSPASSTKFIYTRVAAWDNISFHALNSLFVLLEIVLTNAPAPKWILLPFTLLVLGAYVGVLYLTKLTQGFYGTLTFVL